MIPFKSHLLLTVPPTLEKRLEALAALRTLQAQDEELVRQRRAAIAALRRDFEELRRDYPAFLRWFEAERAEVRRLLKYNPDELRVPKGSAHGGEWTSEGGSGSSPGSMARPIADEHPTSGRGPQYAALETGTQTDARAAPTAVDKPADGTGSGDQYAAVTIERYDQTGNPLIDGTTDILFQTLLQYVELVDRAQVLLGKVGRPLFGTLVHGAFAIDVKAQNLPGIGEDGVEQSFSATDIVKYGADGSIRTDVIMRDVNGRVIAIWDIKTGSAELTDDRRQEIREEVGVSDDVPVIELHIRRGATR